MKVFFSGLAALFLMACSTVTTTDPATGVTTTKIEVSQGKFEVAAHNDLLAAAKYAQDNGYPEVSAVYLADDAKLAAIEAQISACLNAISDAKPKLPVITGNVGPILAFEMAREAVGNFSGFPAKVKILCEPLPIPALPFFPKL